MEYIPKLKEVNADSLEGNPELGDMVIIENKDSYRIVKSFKSGDKKRILCPNFHNSNCHKCVAYKLCDKPIEPERLY